MKAIATSPAASTFESVHALVFAMVREDSSENNAYPATLFSGKEIEEVIFRSL